MLFHAYKLKVVTEGFLLMLKWSDLKMITNINRVCLPNSMAYGSHKIRVLNGNEVVVILPFTIFNEAAHSWHWMEKNCNSRGRCGDLSNVRCTHCCKTNPRSGKINSTWDTAGPQKDHNSFSIFTVIVIQAICVGWILVITVIYLSVIYTQGEIITNGQDITVIIGVNQVLSVSSKIRQKFICP